MASRRASTKALQRSAVLAMLLAAQSVAPGIAAAMQKEMGDPIRGQRLFAEKSCVSCHAIRGAGGRVGPDLGRTAAKSSFFEISAAMWNHSVGMDEKLREVRGVRPTFRSGELRDLIAFIYFLNYFDEPGDPRTGEILFTEKHCIQCHRAGGEGGTAGPSLETLPRGVSPLRIAEGLWNHGPEMADAMRRRGLIVPQFRGSEIIDLFAYVRSQGRGRVVREFESPGDPDKGRSLFRTKGCSRCHGVFAEDSQLGPDLGESELQGSVTQIAGRMWNHWPEMAEGMRFLDMPVPTFEQHELADLLAYIFVSRYAGNPGDADRGRAQYREKGCAFCHGLAGEGTSGPPLSQVTPGADRESVAQRMWNHAPEMWAEMGHHQLPWPSFDAQELADLIFFLTESLPMESDSRETKGERP